MSYYDDILKKMQTGLFNPKGQFSSFGNNFGSNFGNNMSDPDVIKPGGGSTGGTGGTDGTFGGGGTGGTGGTGSGSGSGSSSSNTYTGSGVYGTQFSSLSDLLGSLGYNMQDLTNPGARYGFGDDTEYGELFGPDFDAAGFAESLSALQGLERGMFRDVSSQYSSQAGGMQDKLQSDITKARAQSSVRGLVGGNVNRQIEDLRQFGEGAFEELGQKTQQRYRNIREDIGDQTGMLEGTLFDFLTNASNRALDIQLQDPTGGSGTGGETSNTWSSIPRGNSMTESQLSDYSGFFSDLTNGSAAWAEFIRTAHTNLTSQHLAALANSIYDQYQNQEESGGN